MRELSRAVVRRDAGGRPLPSVFSAFDRAKVSFRSGEVAMIAGQPGSGKSSIALWMVTQWVSRHGLRGIYFSADSSELVQAGRALAMVSTGVPTALAEQRLEEGDEYSLDVLHSKLHGLGWCFDPDITYEVMVEEVEAFEELWGCLPDFLVIDNLTDVDGQAEDEWGTIRRVMKGLTGLARATGAHVLVLHHSSEEFKDEPCPPRRAIQGKPSQKQSLVLTVGEGDGRRKPVCPVKNRYADDPRLIDKTGRGATIWLNIDKDFHFSGA